MNTIMIILLIINLLISLFAIFMKSYFSEKGKNIATKEDIGAITKEVETIKNEISTSILKKNEFEREQKEIALSFFETTSTFIDYTAQVVIRLANNLDDLRLIQVHIEELRSQAAKVFCSFLKVCIYFDAESQLFKYSGDYYDSAIKIQHSVNELLLKLEQIGKRYDIMLDALKNGDMTYRNEMMQDTIKKKDLMGNHIKQMKPLKDESYSNRCGFIVAMAQLLKN